MMIDEFVLIILVGYCSIIDTYQCDDMCQYTDTHKLTCHLVYKKNLLYLCAHHITAAGIIATHHHSTPSRLKMVCKKIK